LDGVAALVAAGRLHGAARIGVRVRRASNKNKVGKHFITIVTDDGFSYRRNVDSIAADAALDGICVIRTSVDQAGLGTGDIVGRYRNLAHIEREFGSIRPDDLGPLPTPHHLTDRVKAHLLLSLLAAYLSWHLRRTLAPLIVTDESIPLPGDPSAPIQRAPDAMAVDDARENRDGLPRFDYPGLIVHLGQLTRNTVSFSGRRFEKIASPTPVQRRVFELLNTSIPPTLGGA